MPPQGKLTRSQITKLRTTTNAVGSFVGNRLQSLQQADLEPGEYTIQFEVVEPPVDGAGAATYAYVSWKVDGQQNQRILSVFSGSSISGVAEAVHIQLLDQSGRGTFVVPGSGFGLPTAVGFTVTNGSPIVTASIPMTLSADEDLIFANQPTVTYHVSAAVTNNVTIVLSTPFTGASAVVHATGLTSYTVGTTLSKGTRATTMQPPTLLTTFASGPIIPGASFSVPIPQDAGIISVLVSVVLVPIPGTGTDPEFVQAAFFAANGFILSDFLPAEFSGWYPVPPGAVEFVVFNPSGNTQDVVASVQWGIEG